LPHPETHFEVEQSVMQSGKYRREGLTRRFITGGLILGCARPMIMFRRVGNALSRHHQDNRSQQRRIEGKWHTCGDFLTHDRSMVVGVFTAQVT
jgi:hypothetical protein